MFLYRPRRGLGCWTLDFMQHRPTTFQQPQASLVQYTERHRMFVYLILRRPSKRPLAARVPRHMTSKIHRLTGYTDKNVRGVSSSPASQRCAFECRRTATTPVCWILAGKVGVFYSRITWHTWHKPSYCGGLKNHKYCGPILYHLPRICIYIYTHICISK